MSPWRAIQDHPNGPARAMFDCDVCGLVPDCVHARDENAEKVYMVVGILDDGGVQLRLGGGSSTPASTRVYPTRKQAERYWTDGQRCHSSKWAYGKEPNMTIRIIPIEIRP